MAALHSNGIPELTMVWLYLYDLSKVPKQSHLNVKI